LAVKVQNWVLMNIWKLKRCMSVDYEKEKGRLNRPF